MYNVNWTTCWRVTFIALGLGVLFALCSDASHGTVPFYSVAAQVFGVLGGICFVIMCVIRFDDVKEALSRLE